jgi:hypothetical protein
MRAETVQIVGSRDLALLTGLNIRSIQREAEANRIPGRIIERGQTRLRFDSAKATAWIKRHTLEISERGRPGRKRGGAELLNKMREAEEAFEMHSIKELCFAADQLSASLSRRMRRISDRLSVPNAQKLFAAMDALSKCINAGTVHLRGKIGAKP